MRPPCKKVGKCKYLSVIKQLFILSQLNYLDLLDSLALYAENSRKKKMEAYMRNQFVFMGVMATERKECFKNWYRNLEIKSEENLLLLANQMWRSEFREIKYCTIDLMLKLKKHWTKESYMFFLDMIVSESWWDTVDMIASNLVGKYLLSHEPEILEKESQAFIESNNLWLQRTSLIFQLKYKDRLHKALLESNIQQLKTDKEFFIQKAIGWSLREASKTNPIWVKDIIHRLEIEGLAKKEASKYLNNT